MRHTVHLTILLLTNTARAFPTIRTVPPPTHYSRLIVFGDSFSDNGTGAWEASSHTWPSDPAYHSHSFSNGPVWPILLSTTLSAPLLDYAVGGATADNSLVTGYTGPNSTIRVPSARDQVEHFLADDAPRDDDLFVHFVGANDPLFDAEVTGAAVASWINADVQRLWGAGAKTVLLANYPAVSTFPATYGDATYRAVGPRYAASLDRGLVNVEAAWRAYLRIGVVNVQGLFEDIVGDPGKYGVSRENVDPPTPCLKGTYGGGPRSVCTDPERYLFWDGYHPVASVHERIAKLFERALETLDKRRY
jgi:phospholipase/lecithinase/hemolysin